MSGTSTGRYSYGATLRLTLHRVAVVVFVVAATAACTTASDDTAPPFTSEFHVSIEGGTAELTFPESSALFESRGAAWRIERWSGGLWDPEWVLGGAVYTIDEWNDSSFDVGDVGIFGSGPDVVRIPDDLDSSADYRICHGANPAELPERCAGLPAT